MHTSHDYIWWGSHCQRPTLTRLIFNSNKYIIMPKVMWKIECSVCCFGQNTVKPVLNSTILSSHPLLSGHLTKFHNVLYSNTVKATLIKWSPVLSRCGHPLHSPKVNYSLFQTCTKWSPEMASNNMKSNAVFNHYFIRDKTELNILSHTLLMAQQSQFFRHKSQGAFTCYLQSKQFAYPNQT